MNRDLTLTAKLYADASRMTAGLLNGERGVKRFASTAKREFESLKNSVTSVEGKLASLGVTIGVTASIIQSAKLDKSLTQIGQTAGASEADVGGLRKELFRMSQETGQGVDDLKDGFNNAVQSGLRFNEALPVIDATNIAMAVTNASADRLTSSLTVASTAYQFDLTKPKMALNILDQMTVAGRLGNAELENLSGIFSRVGPGAASAGLGFNQTLAFIEGLSQIERQPERLATLADSTLRLFNNLRNMKDAQKATGVKFFNADGSRRDAMAVIADIKQQFDKLDTDKKRAVYIQKAFGQADLDTIKGMRVLLAGDMVNTINGFAKQIQDAGGTLERDLPQAISNAVDQVGRLKTALRSAADDFAQPINDVISNATKKLLDKNENGGLGMDGKDLLLAGGGGALATWLTARYGAKAISGIAGKIGGLGAGIATGKALEEVAGVTSVYVVNMPDGGISGLPGMGKADVAKTAAGGTAARALLGPVALGAAPLALMYGATKMAGDTSKDKERASALLSLTEKLNKFFSYDPNKAQREWRKRKDEELGIVTIKVESQVPVKTSVNNAGLKINMANGPLMVHQ